MSNPSLEKAYAYAAELRSAAALAKLPRYIRKDELRRVVPLATSTIYEMEQRGEFPKRVYLTSRCPAWSLADVEAWIERRRLEGGPAKRTSRPDVNKRKYRPTRKP